MTLECMRKMLCGALINTVFIGCCTLVFVSCASDRCAFRNRGSSIIVDRNAGETSFISADEFKPFDRNYPKEWHILLNIPEGAYLSHDGTIYETTINIDGTECKTYVAEFVLKGSMDRIHTLSAMPTKYLKMQLVDYKEIEEKNLLGRIILYGGIGEYEGGENNWKHLMMSYYDASYFKEYSYGEIRITP